MTIDTIKFKTFKLAYFFATAGICFLLGEIELIAGTIVFATLGAAHLGFFDE